MLGNNVKTIKLSQVNLTWPTTQINLSKQLVLLDQCLVALLDRLGLQKLSK